MADQWYFAWGQHKFGPFTTLEMKELAASGRLQPADTVWKEGVATGVLASRVKNLFPNRNPPSTPVPLPPETAVKPEAPVPAPDEAASPPASVYQTVGGGATSRGDRRGRAPT